MVADFLPAFIAGAGQDDDAIIIISFGVDGEVFEMVIGVWGDLGEVFWAGFLLALWGGLGLILIF